MLVKVVYMLVGVEIRHMVIKYQVNLDNTGSNIFITYEIVIQRSER